MVGSIGAPSPKDGPAVPPIKSMIIKMSSTSAKSPSGNRCTQAGLPWLLRVVVVETSESSAITTGGGTMLTGGGGGGAEPPVKANGLPLAVGGGGGVLGMIAAMIGCSPEPPA